MVRDMMRGTSVRDGEYQTLNGACQTRNGYVREQLGDSESGHLVCSQWEAIVASLGSILS